MVDPDIIPPFDLNCVIVIPISTIFEAQIGDDYIPIVVHPKPSTFNGDFPASAIDGNVAWEGDIGAEGDGSVHGKSYPGWSAG